MHIMTEVPYQSNLYPQGTQGIRIVPLERVYPKGTTQISGVWLINSSAQYGTGTSYGLEKQAGEIWETVRKSEDDQYWYEWPRLDLLRILRHWARVEYDLSDFTDGLDAGQYRIVTEVFEVASRGRSMVAYCYFLIK